MTARSAPPVSVPDRPRVIVVLHSDGGGTVNGRQLRIPANADARTVLMTEACRFAATLGRPVRVEAHDPEGVWDLIAHPDGSVTASGRGAGGRKVRRPVLQRRDRAATVDGDVDAGAGPALAPVVGPARTAPAGRGADDLGHGTDDAPAADHPSADRGGPVDDPTQPAWYQAPRATTRPRPAAVPNPGPDRAAPARTGPGLAATSGMRAPARPEPMVWSGRTPGRRPSASRSLLAGLVVGGLGIAALITFTVPGSSERTEQQSSIGSLGAGQPASGQPVSGAASVSPAASPLDLAVPPGYRRTPVWTVDIAGWTRSSATDDGTVLSRDPVGHVLLLDPVGGRTLWSSAETTTNDLTGPWPASIDGARVAIVNGPGRLTYWTLPPSGESASGAVPSSGSGAVTVPLPAGSVVSWAGPTPLILLPNRTVAVIRSGALVPVPLPAGARGLAADANGVLAATASTWLRQPAARPPVAPRPIPRPAKAGGTPLRVEAVGAGMLLTIWPQAKGPGQVVALMDTRSGANVVQTEVTAAADLRAFGIVREVGGSQLALGPLVVDTYAAKVDLLDMRYVVKGLSRGHAWTMFNGKQATDLHLTSTGDFAAVLFGAGEPAVPVGVSRLPDGRSRAIVTAPSGNGWVLAGLAGE